MPDLRRQDHEGPRDPQHAQHQGRPGGALGHQGAALRYHTEPGVQLGLETTRYSIRLHLNLIERSNEIETQLL